MDARPSVCAVVVTYHPDAKIFQRLLRRLVPQVELLVVVDNSPAESTGAEDIVMRIAARERRIRMVRCGANLGVATAHNIGIAVAFEQGLEYVLISDQDSLPARDMVHKLLKAFEQGVAEGRRVASTAPAYVDEVTDQLIPFQVAVPGRCFYRSQPIDPQGGLVEVLTFISSGMLMSCSAIRAIGGLREDLFIDHVDTEWCHRARAMGYELLGTPRARLSHRLGDNDFSVWVFGWRRYTDYSPLRLYYRYRNFLRLWGMGHIDFCWKVRATWYWLGDFYAHMFFSRNRLKKLQMISLGLWHGLLGRGGPFPS